MNALEALKRTDVEFRQRSSARFNETWLTGAYPRRNMQPSRFLIIQPRLSDTFSMFEEFVNCSNSGNKMFDLSYANVRDAHTSALHDLPALCYMDPNLVFISST